MTNTASKYTIEGPGADNHLFSGEGTEADARVLAQTMANETGERTKLHVDGWGGELEEFEPVRLVDALTKAFEDRGFDKPEITVLGDSALGGVDLRWGYTALVSTWIANDGVLCYTLPSVRMQRQGGRLEAIRAAAKSMGLDYREEA